MKDHPVRWPNRPARQFISGENADSEAQIDFVAMDDTILQSDSQDKVVMLLLRATLMHVLRVKPTKQGADPLLSRVFHVISSDAELDQG